VATSTPGTTILRAIPEGCLGGQVDFSPASAGARQRRDADDRGVVGKEPYGEGKGDSKELGLSRDDMSLVTAAKASGKRVVVVPRHRRPLPIEPVIAGVQAMLVVWLPGSEGDAWPTWLFGAFKPTGKLSHSWPRSSSQNPCQPGRRDLCAPFPLRFRVELLRLYEMNPKTEFAGAGARCAGWAGTARAMALEIAAEARAEWGFLTDIMAAAFAPTGSWAAAIEG